MAKKAVAAPMRNAETIITVNCFCNAKLHNYPTSSPTKPIFAPIFYALMFDFDLLSPFCVVAPCVL